MAAQAHALGRGRVGLGWGFTLVELLVVIGIISVLVAIMLPTLTGARQRAQEIQCAANMRQIVLALHLYAAAWDRWAFPLNLDNPPAKPKYWYDIDRIGAYLPSTLTNPSVKGMMGGVFVCPADDEDSVRSYSMNFWVSSGVNKNLTSGPVIGRLWSSRSGKDAATLLLAESWSKDGSVKFGWGASPYLGYAGTKPGPRFGAGTGISPLYNAKRFGYVPTELPYYRHRRTRGRITEPVGRINLGYVDGHVASKVETDLADPNTGLSTLDTWWCPMDDELNTP